MRLVSWNVQGLGGSRCKQIRGRLRLEIQNTLVGGPIDILFIQEHHLSKRRIDSYGSILPGNWLSFWSPGIGDNCNQAGVCLAIDEKWKTSIVHYETLIPGRAQYIVIKEINDNVAYAPNNVAGRIAFWTELTALCPSSLHWCIGGDFNMIERVRDRIGGSRVTIRRQELACWERFWLHLQVMDA